MTKRPQRLHNDSHDRDSEAPRPQGPKGVKRRKILEKARKLLALAGSSNDAEALAAFLKARKLLEEHGLSMNDVLEQPAGEQPESTPPANDDDAWDDVEETPANQWHEPVEGRKLVAAISRLFRKHLVMSEHQRAACALWVLHAHAHDAARHSPILFITAPTIACGKSQLLECLEYLVPYPFPTSDTTAAALFGHIDANYPTTILIDEAETFMAKDHRLRGNLNAAQKRAGAFVSRAGGCRYSTWAPKAIALNGNLHATLESRAIIIRLERKLSTEKVERLRPPKPEDVRNDFNVLRRKSSRWAHDNLDKLRDARPKLPSGLGDRTLDNWSPLFAIADACGWPKRARTAAATLTKERQDEKPASEDLLRDLRRVFKQKGSPLSSREIVADLIRMDARPWAEFMRGRPLTTAALAHLLKTFNVLPSEVKTFSGRRANGYRVEQFREIFKRYL